MRALLPRLARAGPDRLPARARRRLRVQPRVDARPGRQGARGRRADRRGRRGHRLRAATAPARSRRVHTSAGDIAVEQVVVAVGPWIASLWEMLGLPRPARRPHARRHGRRGPGRCGPTGTCRRARSRSTRRRSSTADGAPVAGAARRLRRAELRDDDGRADHRRAVGHLLQARPRERPGRRRAAARWATAFDVDPYPTGTVDPGFPDMWCAALSHCLERFEGVRPQLPPGALGRRRRVHGRQLPGLRLHAPERLRRRRLQPRLQDDRRRPRDRRACSAASTRRCCTRSATSASRPATCTRSRHSPYPWS